jgi:hypothetical protein
MLTKVQWQLARNQVIVFRGAVVRVWQRRDEKLTATFNQDLDSRILIRQVQVWWTEEFL